MKADYPGIYFLKDYDGEIIYIGKAISISKRIAQHIKERKIKFFSADAISLENDLVGLSIAEANSFLGWRESQYIFKHKPIMNKTNPLDNLENCKKLFEKLPLLVRARIICGLNFIRFPE